MGYTTRIELVDAKIRRGRGAALKRYIKEHRGDGEGLHAFLEHLRIDSGFLEWDILEESGKWYDDEAFARWLASYVEEGGKIILHSEEGDGTVWGWEFDGNGMVRRLSLGPDGPWR